MATEEDTSTAKEYPNYQPIDQAENIANKQRVMAIMQQMIDAPLSELNDAINADYHADASVNVTHPINTLFNLDAVGTQYWMPLRRALPDVERRYDILAGGRYFDANW